MQWDSALGSKFDSYTGSIQVRADQIQNGYNHLGTDSHTRWKLYLIAETAGERITVTGFALQNRNGSITLLNPTTPEIDAGPGSALQVAQHFSHLDQSLSVSYNIGINSEEMLIEGELPACDF